MEGIIKIVVGLVIFIAVQYFRNAGDSKKKPAPARQKAPRKKTTGKSNKTQSIDDIFSQFVDELEKKKPAAKKAMVSTKPKQAIDWQEVKKSKFEDANYQLKEKSHRIDYKAEQMPKMEEIVEEEASFDIQSIDWKNAIISKEILERKYT